MNHCLLSLGSNDAPEAALEQAREVLKQREGYKRKRI